jgi:streptogramin lyase
MALAISSQHGTAQQVTYYDFNTPAAATPSQTSTNCGSIAGGPAASDVLFCFNYTGAGPSYIQDFYPPPIDPNANTDGDVGGNNNALQVTANAGSENSSMWFSIPQDVVDGFNVWYTVKINHTPNDPSNYFTADGLAFVIQNATGGKSDSIANCSETGSGLTVLGGAGGCLGYGGIDNSVALEMDTFWDSFDPQDVSQGWMYDDNHLALQSCGLDSNGNPIANSPAHLGSPNCLITLGGTSTLVSNPKASLVPTATPVSVILADGNPHQIVMVYNGPNDSPANYIYVYLDPAYNPGTHTPVAGSTPLFSGPFDITKYMKLSSGGPPYSPAYVGFTAATGGDWEQHELMAWTFTPHASVGQQQPLNPPAPNGTSTTTFNFGTHSYTATFPPGTSTSGVGMGVIANTISPANFASLLGLGATQYSGSACQVYDDTGGNCIIYSVYCYGTSTNQVEACPAPVPAPTDCLSNPSETGCIGLTSAYNNSTQPTSAGFLEGDPLYSPISTIQGNAGTATVTCMGECAVTQGQTVTILGNSDSTDFNSTVTVQTVPAANQFTFASSASATGNGGFITSNNVQDIFASYSAQNMGGSTAGKTKSFSDFVVTAVTTVSTQTQLSATTNSPAPNQSDQLTATITAPSTSGPNSLPLLPPGITIGGTVTFYENSTSSTPICGPVSVQLNNVSYQAACNYVPAQSGPVTVLAQYSGDQYHQGTGATPASLSLNVVQPVLYALTVTAVGSGAGTVTSAPGPITCSEANGIASGTCSGSYPGGSLVTLTANATGTSTFLGWGGACASAGTSPTCNVAMNAATNVTSSFVQRSFGNVNVCAPGQTAPAPCSNTLALTYNMAANTTIGAIQVVTQGATGLDFTLGSGSTCTGSIAAGNSCTVNVSFTPLAPGLRMGAVELFDNGANLLATTLVSGIGQGPAIAFGPGTQTTAPASGLNGPNGVAVDAAGYIFITDQYNHRVVKVTPTGTQTTVVTVPGSGANGPFWPAVDGAGDVFIVDSGNHQVVEITPSGVQKAVPASGLSGPNGVALDGAGDVFISDQINNRVVEVTPNGVQTTVPTTGLSVPAGIALDGAGDVFIADNSNNRVVEVTPSGTQTTVASGLNGPAGVAVDAAGDVFIADYSNNRVVEVTPSGAQTTVASGLSGPYDVALDGAGNVFIADYLNNRVVKVNGLQAPSLSFATTNAGSTSTDSPQIVTVQNVGNQPLTGSVALSLGTNFTQIASPDCSGAFPLAPGATCNESLSFTPQSTGYFTGQAILNDTTLNGSVAQTINLSGAAGQGGQAATVAIPNVVGQTQAAATTAITGTGLALGTVSTASSSTVPTGSVISESPVAGTQVNVGSAVNLLVSTGQAQPQSPSPLSLENNYFVTGDYASAGVTLKGTGTGGMATGTITIPNQSASHGVPDGADIIEAFLYWETLENTPSPSASSGKFDNYSITGQQIGSDLPNYTDGAFKGTLRAYRAEVNAYFPVGANGVRFASGAQTVSLPDSGGTGFPLTEGASLVVIYRVLSQNVPLKAVVIYDGSANPTSPGTQSVQGFYDAAGTGENTTLFAAGGSWNNSSSPVTLPSHANQFSVALNPGNAYAAVILSTPVSNSDNDGILDAWKTGPPVGDFHVGQPGYYDVKTGSWVSLPGAKHGEKDLFVQLDYMCGALLPDGSCDSTKEDLFPSPDAQGNDPLAMVQQAFATAGVQLHLEIGNAVPEDTCVDNLTATPPQLCQFPNQPGVIGWKNSLEFSKLWPRNLVSCATGGDCTTRFPYGQKDSYHYVLFGHSLAIPAWNTRYGTLASIQVANGITTIVTADRGTGINKCPSRITISGVLGNQSLNGVYNTTGCADTKTITLATPGVPNWSYPNNTLAEPVIGLTSGTITSISGYSDLGGADSAVTLGLWLTAPNQDMSKRANVIAGTLFHEIGHTLGLSHGGLYYDTPGSYVPTFEANCKPNYQSVMNYLFQLDLVGPSQAVAYSNQTLTTLNETTAGSVTQLTDNFGNAATYPTSAWYIPYTSGSLASPATLHCDGTPLGNGSAYRVDVSIAPISPAWANGQDINFDGQLNPQMRGYNDVANMDLRQVGATGGEFASLASVLSFGSSAAPLNIAAGGNAVLGSGGTVTLGSGGNVTLGSGGNVTLGSGGTITMGSGGNVTLGSGGNVTLGSGGTITPGSSGTVTLGSGGNVTLGSGGTITFGSGGTVTLGSGGNVTLGSGGTIALGSGGTVTIPSTGGSYSIDSNGGTITLGSGGNVTLGSGGNVTLGSGGTIALGSGGNVTLGSGGNVTLGSGGTVTLGSGGTVTLGSGGNVTLGSGGNVTLGSGGTITLGSGGNVILGSGGTVTLGSGGDVSVGSGGNVTLGSGGTATLGAGGTVTLGSGGNVTLGSGGNVTLGSGGTITMGSGGNVTLGSGGNVTLGSGGDTITLSSGGNVTLGSGGNVTLGSGGTIALGSGGTVTVPPGGSYNINSSGGTITLGSGGNVTLGSGGNVTLGSGGTIALGSGGNVTLGSGGNVTLGSGGTITLGSGGNITLGSGGTVTLGSGGNVTLGSGGVVALGSGGNVTLGSGGSIALGSGSATTQGSGGPTTTELTYETANSIVRPPSSPTETPTPAGVRINWTAPAFGVVATYTIYRSSDGNTPIEIGSVSGVNGNPPATTFLDTNPDLSSRTVVYTISTTLLPVTVDPTQRQSLPSPPAVLKNDQTIALGSLPSSVALPGPQPITATAMSNGAANGLQVSFSTTGPCSIGSQSIANGVSSASVVLIGTGSCTVTASQPGTSAFNSADSVSGAFTILPQGSSTMSQTISFAPLQSVQYGNTFSLSASSSAGLAVSFTASGPCTASGGTTGIGVCAITASAQGNSTYSAASVAQLFTIYPAVLKVTANNLTSVYGQPLPLLTYSYSPLVNGDPSTAVSGTPALSTTATAGSNAGGYPITVSTGSLASANYSFLYVSGTLTIQPASQSALTVIGMPVTAQPYNATFTVGSSGGSGTGAVTFASSGACLVNASTGLVTMTSGTGTCLVTATKAADTNYSSTTSAAATVSASLVAQAITFTANPLATAVYKSSFTVAATGGVSGNAVTFTSSGACSNSGAIYTMTNSTGTCSVIANQAGNTNYAAAPQVTKTVTATGPLVTVSPSTINLGTVYLGSITTKNITVTNIGTAPVTINEPLISIVQGGSSNEFVAVNLCPTPLAAGKSCTIAIGFVAGPFYTQQTATLEIMDNAPGSPQPVTLSAQVINPLASFSPTSLAFGTIKHATSSTLGVTLSNTGATPLIFTGAGISVKGANATAFVQSNNCGSSLAAGAKCTVAVKFTPATTGKFSANLTVVDNAQAGGGTQTVPLSGAGN